MATIFIDIQTIPLQDPQMIAHITQSIKPPATYKNPDSIAKWYQENLHKEAERRYVQTALDGLYGEIFSIAWAIDDQEVIAFWRDDLSSERGLLQTFMDEMAQLEDHTGQRRFIRQWVGHYISGFDLRFLWQRCVINRVKPSVVIPLDAKPWDERVFDTHTVWNGSYPNQAQTDLQSLAQAFGLQDGSAKKASSVYQDWLAGRYEAIADFNRQSVNQARNLYRRMHFMD
ncbi:hypothetical protein [Methylomonas sp. AM2-LC]|uniref:hypothetical protein n=1 Tax=Methylomonas sp. AM2-LC TaxID=3153301 RepID=UPI003267E6D7